MKPPTIELTTNTTIRQLGPLVYMRSKIEAVKGRPSHTLMFMCLPIPMALVVQFNRRTGLDIEIRGLV
jgi:hypothetical protein